MPQATEDELVALATRCEQAAGPDRLLDFELHSAVIGSPLNCEDAMAFDPERGGRISVPHYTDADAAKLVPEGLQHSIVSHTVAVVFHPTAAAPFARSHGTAKTWRLALCAAALRARASQEHQQ
jgi:hypothetical protein